MFEKLLKNKGALSIRELIGNDDVKRVLEDFLNNHLATADGLVIIWSTRKEVIATHAGLTEDETLGLLQRITHKINHEGFGR